MSDEKPKRRYNLKKRAEGVAETRKRITEAAVELHGSIGPARTTMSAVAERAGVQRHTLYRHFPTETELLAACSGHYAAAHPRPDPNAWLAITEPRQRLRTGLGDLYRYYEQSEPMLSNVVRDAPLVEPLAPLLGAFADYLDELARILLIGWCGRGQQRRIAIAIRHAVDFATWRSLVRDAGGTHDDALELMVSLVSCLADGAAPAPATRRRPR